MQAMSDMVKFIKDSIRFTEYAIDPISWSTPHIYLSALAFYREGSIIKEMFLSNYGRIPHVKYLGSNRLDTWNTWDIVRVSSLAFSSEGTRVVSGCDDRKVRVWDARTGQLAMELPGHAGGITSVAYSPNGTFIASGSYDNTVRVWNEKTAQPITHPLEGHIGPVTSVAFSPCSIYIVSGSEDTTIRVWEAQTGRTIIQPLRGHAWVVSSVAFSPNSTRIISGSFDRTVCVWDVKSGLCILGPLHGHSNGVSCVTFSPDGAQFISGSYDASIYIWNASDGSRIGLLRDRPESFEADISCLGISYNWDTYLEATIKSASVCHASFSSDGTRVVSVSYDGTVRVWDVDRCRLITPPLRWIRPNNGSLITDIGPLDRRKLSLDGKRLVSSEGNNVIHVFDVSTDLLELSKSCTTPQAGASSYSIGPLLTDHTYHIPDQKSHIINTNNFTG
jgi:WD40 repeat protein